MLSADHVAAAQADHPELVEPDRDVRLVPALQLVTRTRRFDLGLRPLAPRFEDLRPMHAAVTGELAGAGGCAAALDRFDPFGSPAIVTEVGARADGAAIGRRRCHRPDDAAHRARHGLVEQRKTLSHPAEMDERHPLREAAQCFDVSIADRAPDLQGALGVTQRLVQVAQRLGGDHGVDPGEPSVLRALGNIGKEGSRVLEPPPGHCDRAPSRVMEREIEGDDSSLPSVTTLDECPVRPLARRDALIEMA